MIEGKEFLWVEIYRPRKVQDCIIPDATKSIFQAYVDKKQVQNLILSGVPGTGKTTVARAMCEEIGLDYILINGSVERGIDSIRTKVQEFGTSVSFNGGRKVIIVDEADNLTNDAQLALRGVIEELSVNCTFIFTCNHKHKIHEGIHSRCPEIIFKLQPTDKALMATAFYKRTLEILKTENIPYDAPTVQAMIKKFFPDFRKTLGELQKYSQTGSIDAGIFAQLADAKIEELVVHLKAKDFKALRKWVGLNSDNDAALIMRALYDKMADIFTPNTLPVLVVLTGKYSFQAGYCRDQEINLAAYLTEVMVECECK
jgi:DNA polymerase III delta prime subunit